MSDPASSRLAQARAPRPEHSELLRRRAAALGRVPREGRPRETFPAIVFTLGTETYALSAASVLQVFVLRELTPLPGAQAPLFGLTQWRGDVLLLLDIRADLGIQVRGLTDLGRVIVMEGGSYEFGLLVDAATDVIDVDPAAIRSVPGSASRLVRGMLDTGVVVLDADALLETYRPGRPLTQASGG